MNFSSPVFRTGTSSSTTFFLLPEERYEYTAGIINSVSTPAKINPPAITIPSDWRLLFVMAIGNAPNIMASDVISIGRKRCVAAVIAASSLDKPLSFKWFANSTISIPFLVINPTKVIIPIWLNTFKLCPNQCRLSNAPVTAIGTVSMMINGSLKLSNCAARIK